MKVGRRVSEEGRKEGRKGGRKGGREREREGGKKEEKKEGKKEGGKQFHAVNSTNLVVVQTDKRYSYEWFCKYVLKGSNPNREARTSSRINCLSA